ncbi:hypothetical protein TEA_017717 [Camellia sinensis var. sinensis]|uniref:Pollen Ole e 1 allergen and extensin family protein n=1 Tax=Camellia sinensis var. sinensis TaxID=542762 RepID=A0A4S4DCH6_CAMSN|nr:hypothetical protein TEA_017717 [Camellia sinensis var. sinensis]
MKKMLKLSNGVSVQMTLSLSLSTILLLMMCGGVRAWTGEIHGRVVCDVCGDSSIGPEDHALEVKPSAAVSDLKSEAIPKVELWFGSENGLEPCDLAMASTAIPLRTLPILLLVLHRSIRTDRFLVRPYRLSIDPNDLAPLPFVGQAAFVQISHLHWKQGLGHPLEIVGGMWLGGWSQRIVRVAWPTPTWRPYLDQCAEVAVLCITKSGEVLNYQAFTNSKGIYTVAETMPESDRWDACLARPISSFHEHCVHLGDGNSGVKFGYNHPSGYSHTVRPFVYQPADVPTYCL